MDGVWQDLRYALRMLRRNPGFALVAVLTLALGIGANTAIFSVARAVFGRSLPMKDAGRLMFISRGYPGAPAGSGGGNFSYGAFKDMLEMNSSFDALAAFQSYGELALTEGDRPVRTVMSYVTPSYLRLMGAEMALGRNFRDREDRYGDGDAVIVLSYGFWQRQFAGAKDIVGRTVHLNQQGFTVIGVTAENFEDSPVEIDSGEVVDAWLPLGISHRLTGMSNPGDRRNAILWGVGHLKAGVTPGEARAEFASMGEKFAQMYPATDRGFTLVAEPLQNWVIGAFRRPVWLLIAGSALILLIGCANVATLLLARLASRARELALRTALGATAGRVARQILIENAVLVAAAAVLGVLMALWGIEGLRSWGRLSLPGYLRFGVDAWMLVAAVLVSVVMAIALGAGPALGALRMNIRDALGNGGRQGASGGRRSVAKILVMAQVSLALVLLVGAGLLLKSFHKLTTIDLGFNTKNLLTLRMDLNSERYESDESARQFVERVIPELASVPGVDSATVLGPNMPGHATWVIVGVAEGAAPDDPRNIHASNRHSVNPGALKNLGIPLLRGRDFTAQDTATAPLVGIVSEGTAKTFWPGEDALGKRFRSVSRNNWITVVGVARDVRMSQRMVLTDAAMGYAPGGLGPQRDVYLPYAQNPVGSIVIALRTSGDAGGITKAAQARILSIDSTLPVYDAATLDDRLAEQDRAAGALTALTMCYAVLALFLASLGLFGQMAQAVSRRTQEFGIRMALGATQTKIMQTVLREGAMLAAAGIVAGIAGALALTRAMKSLLFDVEPADPIVFVGIAVLLLMVAAAACWAPARRATRVDPMTALRCE